MFAPTFRFLFHRAVTCTLLVLLSLLVTDMPLQALSQAQMQSRPPMKELARRAAQRPMKLDVHPLTRGARVGDKVSIELSLFDANNQLASWDRQCQIEVGVTNPSGKVDKYLVTIPAGQTAARFTFDAREVGLLTLKARETNDTLLPGGNSMLIGRARISKRGRKVKPSDFPSGSVRQSAHVLLIAAHTGEPQPPRAGSEGIGQGPTGGSETTAPSSPELLLTNSSGKNEILADGKDFARIQVYYMGPLGEPASSDIRVWLTWSNGKLEPQPLVIKKGESFAEAQWSSLSPVDATVSLVTSAPKYAVEGKQELKVSFVPAIYGVAPSSPNPLKLSLIDCEPLVAQFFDREGRTVQTNKRRRITFISSNPSLHLDPPYRDVPPNESAASIFLQPTWSGSSKLDIWTPGYDHQTLEVQVTMWLVLVLCLGGGLVGGIVAKEALKGSIAWRIFVGLVGAIVLVWISVFAVLPQTHSIIAHNLVSVFVVGILGGYGGTRVLDAVGKKLGYF
jgi:hypothetical protein